MSNLGNKKIFANNLKKYMSLHEIDRNRLCADLHFKYSTVSEWLSAKKYPRIDKIELLANYFGIQKSDLIEDKTCPDKETGSCLYIDERKLDEELISRLCLLNDDEISRVDAFVQGLLANRSI